jgi:hypothetical protein
MRGDTNAARPHVDLARMGLGIADRLGNRACRKGRLHYQHARRARDAGDRRDVVDEVEIEIFVKRRVDRVCVRGTKSV